MWTAVLGKVLRLDNLRKKNIIMMEWCVMCKHNGESIDHFLFRLEIFRLENQPLLVISYLTATNFLDVRLEIFFFDRLEIFFFDK